MIPLSFSQNCFLDAYSHLYKWSCPSIGPSIGPSVTLSSNSVKNGFLRILNDLDSRGREAQEIFFPGWKVLKLCSKKYIKNYPFLDASSHLYKRPCPSVRQLVGNAFVKFDEITRFT